MNWWVKIGCYLTGWDYKVMNQSSDASKLQLSKYTSALVILMMIWSVTGYCFAQRYIGLPWWGCCLVSLFFIVIVVMIERQILLTLEKSFKIVAFRVVIAVVMAFIGSTIFDQTMFGKDIDKKMADTVEQQVKDLSAKRMANIDQKMVALNTEKDSLDAVNTELQADVNANPWIEQVVRTNSQEAVVVNGKVKKVNNPSVTCSQVENPKIKVLECNQKKIADLSKEINNCYASKLNVEKETRKECWANVGFLEELEAMMAIISTRPVAGAFYMIFFLLLMSMELFVVVSKMVDKECDYEVAIKGAQRLRKIKINNTYGKQIA